MNKYLAAMVSAALATGVACAGDDRYNDESLTDTTRDTAEEIERSAENTADDLDRATDHAAYETEQAVENAGDEIEDGMQHAGNEIEEGTEYAADQASDYMNEGEGFDNMKAEELDDVTVVLSTGEEIGEIDEVGFSAQHGERVAVVEVGGFLGIGEKDIAVPFSKLTKNADGNAQITMSRSEIEAAAEFDDEWLEEESEQEDAE